MGDQLMKIFFFMTFRKRFSGEAFKSLRKSSYFYKMKKSSICHRFQSDKEDWQTYVLYFAVPLNSGGYINKGDTHNEYIYKGPAKSILSNQVLHIVK